MLAAPAPIVLALALVLGGGLGGAPQRAAGQASAAEVTVQTDDAVPATNVHMLGSSPQEAPGETWGIGQVQSQGHQSWAIVRYAEGAGWSRAPMLDTQGVALSGFAPPSGESPLAGQITPAGAGALLGSVTEETEAEGRSQKSEREVVLVRNPGGAFQEVQAVPKELIPSDETLFQAGRAPLLAPLDEANGAAGALVVPDGASGNNVSENGVLHWDGQRWTREKSKYPVKKKAFGYSRSARARRPTPGCSVRSTKGSRCFAATAKASRAKAKPPGSPSLPSSGACPAKT